MWRGYPGNYPSPVSPSPLGWVVLNDGIGSWEEESLVSVIAPLHPVGRGSILALDSEDDGFADGLSGVVAPDDDLVSDCSLHAIASLSLGYGAAA